MQTKYVGQRSGLHAKKSGIYGPRHIVNLRKKYMATVFQEESSDYLRNLHKIQDPFSSLG